MKMIHAGEIDKYLFSKVLYKKRMTRLYWFYTDIEYMDIK